MAASNKGIRWSVAPVFVLFILSFVNGAARAEPVAIVSDIAGGGIAIQGGSAKGRITITTLIEAGTRLELAGTARLVVIYFNSGDEYTMSGPGLIEFRVKAPVAVSGTAPVRRANPLGTVRLKPQGVAAMAFVMRKAPVPVGIKLLNLERTRTLEFSPEFRWQGVGPGLRYQFELKDETGKALFEVQVDGVALKLPPTVELREDTRYTWTVSTRLGDKRHYQRSGEFSIAPAELRAHAETLRPSSAASVSERVAYAVWLEQTELRDEARGYWRALAAERPEDAQLKELAAG